MQASTRAPTAAPWILSPATTAVESVGSMPVAGPATIAHGAALPARIVAPLPLPRTAIPAGTGSNAVVAVPSSTIGVAAVNVPGVSAMVSPSAQALIAAPTVRHARST